MDKINVLKIIRDHLATLRIYDSEKQNLADWLIFIVGPFAVAGIALWYRFGFRVGVVSSILSAVSIFAGLLLNLLLLVFQFSDNEKFSGIDAATRTRRSFLLELCANLSFAVLVAISLVVLSLVGQLQFAQVQIQMEQLLRPAISAVMIFLLVLFVLTLVMILQRIYRLLVFQFSRPSGLRKTA